MMSNLAGIKAELARVIHLHNYFPVMIKEVSCDVTGKVILEQIEKEALVHGVEVSLAAKSIISGQVRQVSKLTGNGESFERDLQGLLSTIRLLVKRGTLIETDLGDQLLSDPIFLSLPLTALWRFKGIGVVSLEQILKSIHDEKGGSFPDILDDLMELILHKGQDQDSVPIVSETLGALVGLSYNLDKEDYGALSKSASDLLYSVTERLLDFVLAEGTENGVHEGAGNEQSGTCNENRKVEDEGNSKKNLDDSGKGSSLNIYELLMNNLRVTSQALQSYCSSQLIYLLTYQPNLHVASVLKSQEKWRSTHANPILSSLIQRLVIVVGYEAALQSLNTVVTNEEVNWGCVLTLVATSINCHKFSVTLLKGIIEQHIRSGCEDQDIESLVIGFIFARHASQEGRHLFPSYGQWFNALFATESGSPAANKQSFVFLIQFLTDLVPHEPAYCLQAHLTNHIFIPKGCQDLMRDYFNLARARLQDLKDNLDIRMTPRQNLQEKDKMMKEVESCIEHYTQTSRIPNFVLEASIFRKPYYRSSFLPTLLSPRTLPDEPDARSKFIECLHSSGKIPPNMFKNYVEECQKLTSDLLSGVFINVEDDIIIEEPMTELSNILKELVKSTSVLPILSRVSQKIEEMMKVPDLKMKSNTHLMPNARLFNSKLVSCQVIQEFVSILERVCFTQNGDDIQITRPDWLPQFLSLLSSSTTLQAALFNYLLYHLECGHLRELSRDKIQIQGALMYEICSIEGLFLPVVDSSALNDKPTTLTVLYLNKLKRNISTKQACIHTCCLINFWLNWYMKSGTDTGNCALLSLPLQLMNIYCLLAPRIAVIRTEGDPELTMAHVYSLLVGQGIPDCAKIYFDQINKSPQQHKWMPLEDWIVFELSATWEDTPVDVRLTYLQCRIQQDFLAPSTTQTTNMTKYTFSEIILKIILTLSEVGIKENNSSEMIMLLQRLAQLYPDADICLLEEWHNNMSEKPVDDKSVWSYMNICRCLPPSYFLPPTRLLQLSGALEQLVALLKTGGQGLQLNLCDTAFLISCLLHAGKDVSIKDIQIEKCLRPIKTAVIFYWESVESLFEDNIQIVGRYSCLETLRSILKDPVQNLYRLTPEEGGVALLSLCLKNGSVGEVFAQEISESMRTNYLKWLFAYLGLQQLKELIPFFPSEKQILLDINEKDEKVIYTCRRELQKYLITYDSSKLVEEFFHSDGDTSVALRMVPTACVLVLLVEFTSPKTEIDKCVNKDLIEMKQFEFLLQCHSYIGLVFDSCESESPKNFGKEKLALCTNKDILYSKDIGYVSDLYQRIFSILSKVPPKMLCKISKSTISKCEGELKSTLQRKLQGIDR